MQLPELIANIDSNLSDFCWECRNQNIADLDHINEVQQVMQDLLGLWNSGKEEISFQEYQEYWAVDPHEIYLSAWTE